MFTPLIESYSKNQAIKTIQIYPEQGNRLRLALHRFQSTLGHFFIFSYKGDEGEADEEPRPLRPRGKHTPAWYSRKIKALCKDDQVRE